MRYCWVVSFHLAQRSTAGASLLSGSLRVCGRANSEKYNAGLESAIAWSLSKAFCVMNLGAFPRLI